MPTFDPSDRGSDFVPAADIVAALGKQKETKQMSDTKYEKRPNTGVAFNPAMNEEFVGSGRINLDGAQYDDDLVIVKRTQEDGTVLRIVYRKIGPLYENDKKGNDSAPDFSGPMWIDGVRRRMAAWIKTSAKTGASFLSLSIDGKDNAQAQMANQQKAAPATNGEMERPVDPAFGGVFDNDIPF